MGDSGIVPGLQEDYFMVESKSVRLRSINAYNTKMTREAFDALGVEIKSFVVIDYIYAWRLNIGAAIVIRTIHIR